MPQSRDLRTLCFFSCHTHKIATFFTPHASYTTHSCPASRQMAPKRTFWSKSGDRREYLSNFTECKAKLWVTGEMCERYGFPADTAIGLFRSAESLFQAIKASVAKPVEKPANAAKAEMAAINYRGEFRDGGAHSSGPAAQKAGKEKAMTKAYLVLDEKTWDDRKDDAMRLAIEARLFGDPKYKKMVYEALDGDFTWLHLDPRRDGKESYWGGCMKDREWCGQNKLGKIMSEVARVYRAQDTEPTEGKRKSEPTSAAAATEEQPPAKKVKPSEPVSAGSAAAAAVAK